MSRGRMRGRERGVMRWMNNKRKCEGRTKSKECKEFKRKKSYESSKNER